MPDPAEGTADAADDLWFLPGPSSDEPEDLSPRIGTAARGRRCRYGRGRAYADWQQAEAGEAAHLARMAARLGALYDRLRRGPEGLR